MVQWSDSFWGEGNRGFEILSNNIKTGAIAIEEFQRFFNEYVQCESTYSKNLSRIQSQFFKAQNVGTFAPIWNLIRDLFDKVASTHLVTVNFYQDLLRDIHNYQDLYQKKVKTYIQKDADILRTAELLTLLHNALNAVHKAKEQYHSTALDYERVKRGGNNSLSPSSTSTSQDNNVPSLAQSAINSLQSKHRLERKHRQAQEDYKITIEKYNSTRKEYEKRFSDASSKFQSFEIDHVEKMLALSLNYSEILQRNTEQIRLAENDFNEKLKLLTGNDLLDLFVEQRKTGTDRPVPLQFEEIDNTKTPDLPPNQDDLNLFDKFESGVPSFQAHFSVQSPPVKQPDTNRGLGTHSLSTDSTMYPSNSTSTPVNPLSATSSIARSSQNGNSRGEQTSNPFDLRIKRTKFPGFFGAKTKEKKEKKFLTSTQSVKLPVKQHSRDGTNGSNLRNSDDFAAITDNDDYGQIPSNTKNNKSLTPEPYSGSSPSNDDINRTQFSSSKISQSSISSDTSDDEDNMMTKIFVKINEPKSQVFSDEDDETKISNAMRSVGQNILINSRASSNKTSDVNKSISTGQIGARILPPPPIVARSALTIQNSNIDHSNMFPPHDEFAQIPFNSINQENLSIPSQSTSERKNATSMSSNEDDTEVANSFRNNDLTNKISFPILQVPPLFQSHQQQRQQSATNSISPSFASVNQSLNNSPLNPNEFGGSPLTIGAMDQIPLAIAFQETIHAMISGDNQENWKCRISGQLLISFPSSMLNLLFDPSRVTNTLEFRLKNLDNIQNITVKPSLIIQNESSINSDELIYSFDMIELNNILRNLQEKNSLSPFFNLNILNYELKQPGASNIPIQISSQWTRAIDTISVNIKYHFNSSILPETIRFNNNTVTFYTIITDGQQIKESSPIAEWSANENKLSWKVPYISNGTGNLSATILTMQTDTDENDQPLTTSSIVKAFFIGENALFSSIDLDLNCRGYRISLLKKKILSGKYQSEPDQDEPIQLFKRPIKSPITDT